MARRLNPSGRRSGFWLELHLLQLWILGGFERIHRLHVAVVLALAAPRGTRDASITLVSPTFTSCWPGAPRSAISTSSPAIYAV